jgi:membrane protein YqaA with SNARE-associated domain
LRFVPGLSQEAVDHVGQLYQQNAFWAIFAAAFTPIPYKVFTIAGGIFQVPLTVLIGASILGRSARFFLVATAIFFFGPSVRKLLEERLELLTIALFVLIVLGFVVVKYFLH